MLAPLTMRPTIATPIAQLNWMATGLRRRSMLSQTMRREKPASRRAPVKPPRALTLPVPKLNFGLVAFLRA